MPSILADGVIHSLKYLCIPSLFEILGHLVKYPRRFVFYLLGLVVLVVLLESAYGLFLVIMRGGRLFLFLRRVLPLVASSP